MVRVVASRNVTQALQAVLQQWKVYTLATAALDRGILFFYPVQECLNRGGYTR